MNSDKLPENKPIGVIGLGYVGLPLAVAFGQDRDVIGFDIDATRIDELRSNDDRTHEVSTDDMTASKRLHLTSDPADLERCGTYIVTVPTPITPAKTPDLSHLRAASRTVGQALSTGDLVIFESTVYPGATEEDCVPILEQASDLTLNVDFSVGYSPERMNPGDPSRRIGAICKVIAASNPAAADRMATLYGRIVSAGLHRAPSIRVAEAAKVIENTQRDLNIALVNELAIIFARMGLDTQAIIDAAATKWNFQAFRPGLVGGHCIGVDPYYLTHKAEAIGYQPEIILAGRRLNDSMSAYVAGQMVKGLLQRRLPVDDARVLILGLTFKENCPDIRNSQVITLARELSEFGIRVDVHDPWVDPAVGETIGIEVIAAPEPATYDGIVLAVGHRQFHEMGADAIRRLGKEHHLLYDLKYVLPAGDSDLRL
ncbi:MAG: nucleotide sugar dehydrogenase [Pseudomonadota bacterium]